ncbi:MAG TPA: 30S ribosomal protein S18 [Patescibacteria group bacterium]|nr:30S ribosomal protein S18 [Patescibacteria group bacterium]
MKKCFFCTYKITPHFKDVSNLEKFLTIRKKIVSSEKSTVCAHHQRMLSKQIKYARYLALIPYISYQK